METHIRWCDLKPGSLLCLNRGDGFRLREEIDDPPTIFISQNEVVLYLATVKQNVDTSVYSFLFKTRIVYSLLQTNDLVSSLYDIISDGK